jgi:3-isopropylmalate dehydrogenase
MTAYRLGVLDGDGIGAEIVTASVDALSAAVRRAGGVEIEWVRLPMGLEAIRAESVALSDQTKRELANCHGWVMGPHDSVAYPEAEQNKRNPSGELRHHFDLYANIRPSRSFPGVPGLIPDVDLVIVRENTEGFYPDRNMHAGAGEFMPTPDVALSTGVFTRRAAERIARTAFNLASGRRKYVSIVHKANVIRLGTGLFRDVCYEVGEQFPDVNADDYHVDAMAAHLVRRAADFDVIVTTNMFGDILSDLAAELVGSLGLAASLNAGEERAMAQAAHGSAPDIAGQGIANPIGEMLSGAMLLGWLADRHNDDRLRAAGAAIDSAIERTLADGISTRDLGGDAGTEEFTREVVNRL